MSATLNIQSSYFNEIILHGIVCFVKWLLQRKNTALDRKLTFRGALCFLLCQIICYIVFRFMFYLCAPCPRLLKDRPEFVFVPRSRQELPANFPEDIPGVCYFLEASFKTSKLPLKWSHAAKPKKTLDMMKHKCIQWTQCKHLVYFGLGCLNIDDIVCQSNSCSCLITEMSVCCRHESV